MSKEKKPMDDIKKAKLMYSGELGIFAVIFLVLGILEITFVLSINDVFITIFQYVGLVGGVYFIVDLIWTLKSEKKRAKNSMFDKIGAVPAALYSLTICILMVSNVVSERNTKQLLISILLLYFAGLYAAEAIYHWYHIHPSMLQAIEEDRKDAEKKKAEMENMKLGEDKKEEKVVEVTPIEKQEEATPTEKKEETPVEETEAAPIEKEDAVIEVTPIEKKEDEKK